MGKGTKKIVFSLFGIIVAAVCVVVLYYLISEGKLESSGISTANESEVQKLLEKDIDTSYPETPAEVVKLYWRYNKCIYNNAGGEKNTKGLLKQIRKFYDTELLEGEGNSWDEMLKQVKNEQAEYAKKKRTISTYVVQPNSTVQYADLDGKESAAVMSGVLTKEKSKRLQVYEKFICRKDQDGRWRILGWKQTKDANDIAYLGDN